MTRNPFRRAEKVLKGIGNFIIGIFLGSACALFIAALVYTYGWWTILIVPSIIVGVFLVGALFGLLSVLFQWIEEKWDEKKYEWDNKESNNGI